jgi:predicted enzyme related to lactoylglutathione lyase
MKIGDYPEGAPCWFELETRDPTAGQRFWSDLLGWTCDEFPMPGSDGVYTMFALHGDAHVAACCPIAPEAAAQGVPPHWNIYFRVHDCDAATARAAAAGGRVLAGPFDVEEHGRMSIVADPEGAAFGLWQPLKHRGAGRIHEEHAVGWVELAARDAAAAASFYRTVLGWEIGERQMPHGLYRMFSAGGTPWGGLLGMTPEWGDLPAHWSIYWRVPDVDVVVARAISLGGMQCFPSFDAPGVGRIGRINDPQGAGAYLIAFPPGS